VGADGSLDLLDHLPEPVPLFSQRYGLPCPLVPFTKQQVRAVNSPLFLRLLKAVGLQVPTAESVYPLVPTTLPAAYLFSVAQRLAPLDTASLKFDPALLEKMVLGLPAEVVYLMYGRCVDALHWHDMLNFSC